MKSRTAIGFAFVSLSFIVFAVGNILTEMSVYYRDPGPPLGLTYRPEPPSCCGDSICNMENHHEWRTPDGYVLSRTSKD